jgi:outer membrane murein-binding lipoprotein Lpp
VQDIDELIEKFKAADDQNYTLFTYVNELNQEITKLEEQVKGIEAEIDAAQRQAVARASSRLKVQQEVCHALLCT